MHYRSHYVLKSYIFHSVTWMLNGVLKQILICMHKCDLLPSNSCCKRKTDECGKKGEKFVLKNEKANGSWLLSKVATESDNHLSTCSDV